MERGRRGSKTTHGIHRGSTQALDSQQVADVGAVPQASNGLERESETAGGEVHGGAKRAVRYNGRRTKHWRESSGEPEGGVGVKKDDHWGRER